MDNEEIVLDVAQNMIRILGHEVELAADDESAVEKYRQRLASELPLI